MKFKFQCFYCFTETQPCSFMCLSAMATLAPEQQSKVAARDMWLTKPKTRTSWASAENADPARDTQKLGSHNSDPKAECRKLWGRWRECLKSETELGVK